MIDSWNAAVLNNRLKKLDIPNLLDQVETGTWNLIRTPYFHGNGSTSGLTYKVNDDGSITFTGKATATFNYNVKRYTQEVTLPPGNYRLKGCPADGSASTYYLRIGYVVPPSTTVTWLGYDYGAGFDFTLDQTSNIQINCVIANGYEITQTGGLIFMPEIDVIELPLCTKATAGNYYLTATVDSDGVITYSWEEVAP